jgi:hypothetical protein
LTNRNETLYPVGTGLKRISSAKLKIAVMDFSLPSGMNDFSVFFSDARGGKVKILGTKSLEIKVIP